MDLPGFEAPIRHATQPIDCRAVNASRAWCEMSSSAEIARRTTPSRSITNVTRFDGSHPAARVTPKAAASFEPLSLTSGNGRSRLLAKDACRPSESLLTPTTSAPSAVNSEYRPRKSRASTVQPGVKSLG